MTTILDCIERIPEKLKGITEENFSSLVTYTKNKDINEIIFVCSGSSYNGAFAAKNFIEKCGYEVSLEYPNVFFQNFKECKNKALHVFISQGGETKLVYESMLKVKEHSGYTCAITWSHNSSIAKEADISIDMGCGNEEFLYRTIGYSTTVATCMLMALAIKKSDIDTSKVYKDYTSAINNLDIIKEKTMNWFGKHKFSIMRRNKMILTGSNLLWPIAQEADIKFMEMVPMMTRSFELEELIHGPQNAFDADTSFIIFSKEHTDNEKVKAIANFLKTEISFCSIIGANAQDDYDLPLDIKSEYFFTLEFITVAQILAYEMAISNGRDLHRGVNSSIKEYITKTV